MRQGLRPATLRVARGKSQHRQVRCRSEDLPRYWISRLFSSCLRREKLCDNADYKENPCVLDAPPPVLGCCFLLGTKRYGDMLKTLSAPEVPLCLYIDVDGTLVRTAAGNRFPDHDLIHQLRKWKANGAILYCWSSHGARYARSAAEELNAADCFTAFLTKPHALVDDQEVKDWPYFMEMAPSCAARLSLAQIRKRLDGL